MDENTGEFNLRRVNLTDSYPDSSSDSARLLSQVQQTLYTCAQSIESDDFHQSESSVGALVDFLDSVSTAALSDPDSTFANENASAVLAELHRFVFSSSLNQMVIDSLSFELPKAVVKFVGVSDECCKVVEDIIDRFITVCSPRDMLSVLCDALDSLHKVFRAPTYFIPLLGGISKVFLCIQRRHFEQAKEAFPIILSVLKAASLESGDEDKESSRELVSRSIDVATSIQTVCQKSIVKRKEELHALLGLYVLQVMACITSNLADRVSSCIPSVIRLSQFFPVCGLSYLGLITGRDVDSISGIALGEDDDGIMGCFSFVKHGASLAVIWGHVSNEVAKTAGEDFTSVKDKLRSNQIERWQAIGMLRYVLSALDQPWELKGYAIDLLLSIMDGSVPQNCDENHIECSSYMPGLFTDLQAVEKVIIYASDTVLRKKAFAAMKRVISDIPNCQRFDVLKALITNSSSPSMVAILMDIVKGEIHMESCQKVPSTSEEVKKVETKVDQSSLFWSSNAMELVEFILKPPRGGPPSLPEESEADLNTKQVLGGGREVGGLYLLDSRYGSSEACSTSSSSDVWLWHCRFGYPADSVLKQLVPSLSFTHFECEPCQYGKHIRSHFPPSMNKSSSTLFSLIHSDVWKSPIVSRTGFLYFVTFIDDFSRMTWTYLMKQKSEVFDHFQNFYQWVQNQFGCKIQILRSDKNYWA